jgi:hypothetical protein
VRLADGSSELIGSLERGKIGLLKEIRNSPRSHCLGKLRPMDVEDGYTMRALLDCAETDVTIPVALAR